MHVDIDVCNGLVAVPAGDLLNHQLQLVEKLRVDCGVARPYSLLIVVQEIANFEVLGDRQVDVRGADLEEPFGRRRPTPDTLADIRPNAITPQHSPLLLGEGNQHCQSESFYRTSLASFEKCQMIKTGLRWC